MACCTVALSALGAATTLMSSSCPASWIACCAVGRVNAARVDPARLLAVPNWAMPLIVKVRDGPANRMRTRWPTVKSYSCAVPASITTSSRGHRRPARDQMQAGDLLIRVEVHAEGRLAAVLDRLAVGGR